MWHDMTRTDRRKGWNIDVDTQRNLTEKVLTLEVWKKWKKSYILFGKIQKKVRCNKIITLHWKYPHHKRIKESVMEEEWILNPFKTLKIESYIVISTSTSVCLQCMVHPLNDKMLVHLQNQCQADMFKGDTALWMLVRSSSCSVKFRRY